MQNTKPDHVGLQPAGRVHAALKKKIACAICGLLFGLLCADARAQDAQRDAEIASAALKAVGQLRERLESFTAEGTYSLLLCPPGEEERTKPIVSPVRIESRGERLRLWYRSRGGRDFRLERGTQIYDEAGMHTMIYDNGRFLFAHVLDSGRGHVSIRDPQIDEIGHGFSPTLFRQPGGPNHLLERLEEEGRRTVRAVGDAKLPHHEITYKRETWPVITYEVAPEWDNLLVRYQVQSARSVKPSTVHEIEFMKVKNQIVPRTIVRTKFRPSRRVSIARFSFDSFVPGASVADERFELASLELPDDTTIADSRGEGRSTRVKLSDLKRLGGKVDDHLDDLAAAVKKIEALD